MKVCAAESIPDREMPMEGADGVRMRVLIGEQEAGTNFVMRQFEIEPGGHTPHHQHPYEHQIFVLGGEGIVVEGGEPRPIHAGDCIFVPGDEPHQFRNTSGAPLQFLCLIPRVEPCRA